jgi:hypothetical protein
LYLEEIILFFKIFFGFGFAHLLAFIVDWQQKIIIWMYYNLYVSHMHERASRRHWIPAPLL